MRVLNVRVRLIYGFHSNNWIYVPSILTLSTTPNSWSGNRNCEALCNTGELSSGVTGSVYDAFRERIDTVLTPVLETLVNETLRDLNANPFRIEIKSRRIFYPC